MMIFDQNIQNLTKHSLSYAAKGFAMLLAKRAIFSPRIAGQEV